jgi:hypothetical protein
MKSSTCISTLGITNPPSHHQNSHQARQPKQAHPSLQTGRTFNTRLDNSRIPRRKHSRHAEVGRLTDFLGSEKGIVQGVARRPVVASRDAVGDRDGQVKDGVVVLIVEAEGLADGDLDGILSAGTR